MFEPDKRYPQRRHPADGVIEISGQPTIVFDTVCTKDRTPWLACDEVHDVLVEIWKNVTGWVPGRYMIMPDHIHYFAGYREGVVEFQDWVKYWKSQFSKQFKRPNCRWQAGNFDHRIRSRDSYAAKWQYVRDNPVRHRLVEKSADWPYQGEIHVLRWD